MLPKLPRRQGSDTNDYLTIMASPILRALRSLGRGAAGLGAQGLIVLIAVGTPIAGLCLLAYISPILVRTILGERSVILACLLWLALSTFSAIYLYNAHVLPLTLRLGERIKAWHQGLKLRETTPVGDKPSTAPAGLPFQNDSGMARSFEGQAD